jgi:AraC-like DNA-binding protein
MGRQHFTLLSVNGKRTEESDLKEEKGVIYGYEGKDEAEVISCEPCTPSLSGYHLEEDVLRLMRRHLFLIFEESAEYGRRGGNILVVADEVSRMPPSVSPLKEADLLFWTGGKEGVLHALRQENFDVVLFLCLRLDDNVVEVVGELKSFYPRVLVMVVGIDASGELVAEDFWTGARDCLVGNVEADRLRERVVRVLEIANDDREQRQSLFSGKVPESSDEGLIDPDGLDDLRLRDGIKFVHGAYERNLSLDEIAGAACMTRRHLRRVFKKEVGLPPMRYLSRVRVVEAKRMLRESECLVAKIAYSVGFGTLSHFYRMFGEFAGLAPNEYRRRVREESMSEMAE